MVKDRMDITGARWGVDTAEAILKLRALHANGDFEDYWAHMRNFAYAPLCAGPDYVLIGRGVTRLARSGWMSGVNGAT